MENSSESHHFVFNKNGEVLDLIDFKRPVDINKSCAQMRWKYNHFCKWIKDTRLICRISLTSWLRKVSNKDTNLSEHPSLAFVGFVCPMVGSVTVASVFSDKINLLCMVGKERSRKERRYFLALSLQEFITEN